MGNLAIWRAIWTKRRALSREYAADVRMANILHEWQGSRGHFSDEDKLTIIEAAGIPCEEGLSAFDRLFWSGVVKRVRYSPPKPCVYRVTDRLVRMPPLHSDGATFRPPLRRDGKFWGPATELDKDAIPPRPRPSYSESEALALFERIGRLLLRFDEEIRLEMCQEMFADVLAGELPEHKIESSVQSYLARQMMQREEHNAPLGVTELTDWAT